MHLLPIWHADTKKAYCLQSSFEKDEHGFVNPAYQYTYEEFLHYVKRKEENSKGKNLQKGFVPDTVYILVNDAEEYVGIFNFRHTLNDFLKEGPGHIGYGIAKTFRGQGYASKGLKLLIEKVRDRISENEIYLECNKDNLASLHVMIHNQGYIHHESDTHYYVRIKKN